MDGLLPKIILLLNQERWKDAETAARLAIGNDPDSPWNYHFLARALLEQRKHREAEAAARRSIELDPEDDGGYCCLARILSERKRFPEARDAIRTALEVNPDDPDNHGILAQIHMEKSEWRECLEACLNGLALDPDNDLCQFYRGVALTNMGDRELADSQFQELLAENPEDAANHVGLGWSKIASGHYDAARMHFSEALRIEPNRNDAREGLVTCLKARNPIFAWILKVSIILERYRAPGQIALLIAFIAGSRVIKYANTSLPDFFWLWHGLWVMLWLAVILLTIGHALFNLTLSCKKEGRLTLSTDDRRAACWGWPFLIVGCLFLANWVASGKLNVPLVPMIYLGMIGAVAELFESQSGWVRKRLGWLLVVCVLLPIVTPLMFLAALIGLKGNAVGMIPGLTHLMIWSPLVALVGVNFADNIRNWLERRAPDDPDYY